MESYALTDVGRVRAMNQDYIYASPEPVGTLPNLFLVADGMGGHRAGDYASRYMVENLVIDHAGDNARYKLNRVRVYFPSESGLLPLGSRRFQSGADRCISVHPLLHPLDQSVHNWLGSLEITVRNPHRDYVFRINRILLRVSAPSVYNFVKIMY